MLLLERQHIAQTHHAALMSPAFAHANTAHGRVCEDALVLGKLEVGHRTPWLVVHAQSQVLADLVGFYNLSRVHLPFRIPETLELFERVYQFLAEHFWQKLRARLSVAMLAGERSAVAHHQIGGVFYE